eukprot:scaffold259804_cov46-Prasinocladus_malaysianus.AAC.1
MRTSLSNKLKANNSVIVSVAGLYPGCARHCELEEFGKNVRRDEELCLPIPVGRWDVEATYHPDGPSGTSYMRVGIFVTGLEDFDSKAFGFAAVEAVGMDPQARVLLELTNSALDRASLKPMFGNDVSSLASGMGVFVGILYCEYYNLLDKVTENGLSSTTIMGTGMGSSLVVGRISFVFGSQGPCLSTDTACSSSLVSSHLAHTSLQIGESQVSLVAGANSMIREHVTLMFCVLKTLSPDGRSKSFDQSVDGYGRGEAFAAMLLAKDGEDSLVKLEDCLGLVCGSAINQDGRSGNLTAPNGPSQTKLILQALKSGNMTRTALNYIAVHGTGTPLGDPIEIGALSNATACGAHKCLALVSVKSCYGHTEGAAGITGLCMAAFGLQHQVGPGIMHLRTPNPHVTAAWQDWVSRNDLWPWAPRQCGAGAMMESRSMIGSTSSFGISGVNAHC